MNKIVTFLFIGILFPFISQAQINFEKVYGRPSPYNDGGIEVHQTSNNEYVIGATSNIGEPNYDFWLVKTDSLGDTLWTNTYGGPYEETCRGIALTSDGGYILTGWTVSFASGYEDVYLVKTDSDGNFMWQKSFGGSDDYDAGYAVRQTNDAGYIIAGETGCFGAVGYDFYLVKTDSLGNLEWQKNYGYGYTNDQARDVQQTSDGGYILAGYVGISGQSEQVYVIKTDSTGEMVWSKVYGTTGDLERAWSVKQTSDNGYIIAATKAVNGSDVWLLRTDPLGDTLWTKTYGGNEMEIGYSVDICSDEGHIITGWTKSYGAASTNVYLVKTDRFGTLLWQKNYDYYNENYGYCVEQTSDGGYITVGSAGSWISGGSDVYLIKTSSTGIQEDIKNPARLSLSAFPSISGRFINISFYIPERQRVSLLLYDILGRKVKSLLDRREIQGIHRISFNSAEIPSGIYFFLLKTEDRTIKEKFVNFTNKKQEA